MNIKSITLTVAELADVLSISDENIRRQALEAVNNAVANPEKIDLDSLLDGPSVILTLVHKVYRRYETAMLRAENKKKRQAEAEARAKTDRPKGILTGKAKPAARITARFNEPIVRRLLWLKQHLAETIDQLSRALTSQADHEPMSQLVNDSFMQVANMVRAYLKPMIDYASTYYRIPKDKRDGIFTLDLPIADAV